MSHISTFQSALTIELFGEMPLSIEWHLRALEMFRQLGRRDREARVLNRLGDQSRKVGEMGDAARYFDRALPLAREMQDPVASVDILNNTGLLRSSMGDFEQAIEELQSAIPLAQAVNASVTELSLMCNVAEAYRMLGLYDRSVETYERALEVARRVNLPRRTGRTLYMLAETYIDTGDPARAEQALRTSLDLYEQSGDRTGHAVTLAMLGRALRDKGDRDGAVEAFTRALPVLRTAQARGGIAMLLRWWAGVHIERGEVDQALEKLDESLRLERLTVSPDYEAETLYLRARALRKADKAGDAIAPVVDAIRIVDAMRGDMQRSDSRTSFQTKVRSYFDLYIDLLQERGSSAAAFEMSERGRARMLLEGLAESAARIRKGVDPDLLSRQRALQMQVNGKEYYRAQVVQREGEKSPRAVAATRELEAVLEQLTGIEAKIRAASPAYWALQRPEPITLERVQKTLLDEGSALVEYHIGASRSYAWAIDRQSITVHDIPPAATIDEPACR